ncbi:hypothetical protein PRIPAC_75565 [Pristionchus pacificus]|uniref:Uncharacterized protein n=1 Tax=Pristionchus pacificus TaxID=54126 RepID=A0A2A6C5I9_PRIPA|nr:hypothetical protein PRIPAC_75565 [Pristionchus pacificus]|eukprot:PDM73409.1 hypothetical protein PRIPAC_40765 [Pristionchus pacificus]
MTEPTCAIACVVKIHAVTGPDRTILNYCATSPPNSDVLTRVVCSSETWRALALAEFIFDSLGPVGSLASEK